MDIARGEMVEKELNAMIERRSRKGEVDTDEFDPGYMESVRRYNARRREEMRAEWCEHPQGQAVRLRAVLEELIADHEEQAEKYYRKELEMSRRKSTKKVRERRRSLKIVKPRRQMNGRKAGATDRGRVKGMGIGGWA